MSRSSRLLRFYVGGSKFARVLETLGIQSLSFQDNSCYEKHNAKETIDEMQSAVNKGY